MNICIVTHGIAPDKIGGSETQTLGLATELAKKHRVTVITRRKEGRPRTEEKNGFVIRRLGRKYGRPVPFFSFNFEFFREMWKSRKKIDILMAKTIYFGFLCLPARYLLGLPLVVLIEGEQEYMDESLMNRFTLRVVSRRSRMKVQTEKIREELLRKTGVEADVIPNGLYPQEKTAAGEKVIFAGRLIRDKKNDKGVRFLIEAVRDTGLETLIIGDGPEREHLESLAREEKNISFAGEVPPEEIIGCLLQGFVLVLPSVYGEGLPNVILEAMSVGLPVISTATAGIADIIEHGRTGFIVEPENASALRASIELLRKNRVMWEDMSRNCRREAASYDWENIARRFERLFEEAILNGK